MASWMACLSPSVAGNGDKEGLYQCNNGKYHHLLLVNVLRGSALDTESFGSVQSKFGEECCSVEGGPHRPTHAGPSQCLPEVIVTHTEIARG